MFGLSLYTGEKDLREIFCKYGGIDRVQVVYDHQVRKGCGCGQCFQVVLLYLLISADWPV